MAERIEAVKAMANNIFQVFDIDKSGDLDVKELGRKTPLLKPCCTKMIILPRQAQDKHRKALQKKTRVLQALAPSALPSSSTDRSKR